MFTPLTEGPGDVGEVTLNLRVVEGRLTYLPPLSVAHRKVEAGMSDGQVRVMEHSATLALMETRHNEGLALASPLLEGGGLSIPVISQPHGQSLLSGPHSDHIRACDGTGHSCHHTASGM